MYEKHHPNEYAGPYIIGLAFLPFRFSFDSWNTVVVTKQAPSKKPVDWEVCIEVNLLIRL